MSKKSLIVLMNNITKNNHILRNIKKLYEIKFSNDIINKCIYLPTFFQKSIFNKTFKT